MALPVWSSQTVSANGAGGAYTSANGTTGFSKSGYTAHTFAGKGRFKFSLPEGVYVKRIVVPFSHQFGYNYYYYIYPDAGIYMSAQITSYYRWGAYFSQEDGIGGTFSQNTNIPLIRFDKGTSVTNHQFEWNGVSSNIYAFNGYPTATDDSERGIHFYNQCYTGLSSTNVHDNYSFTTSNAGPVQMTAYYYTPIVPELGATSSSNITKTTASLSSNLIEDGYYDNDGDLGKQGCTIRGFCYKLSELSGDPSLSDNVHTASYSTSLSDPNKRLVSYPDLDSYSQAATAQWEIGRTYIASTTGTVRYYSYLQRVSNAANATFYFRIRKNGVDQWTYSTMDYSSNISCNTLLSFVPGDVITFETKCSIDLPSSMGYSGAYFYIDQDKSTIYQIFQQPSLPAYIYTEGAFTGTLTGVNGGKYKVRSYAINAKGISYGATSEVRLNGFNTPENAFAQDGVYTSIPASSGTVAIKISTNGGSTYSSEKTVTLGGSPGALIAGGTSDTWGLSIDGDEMGNAYLKVKIYPQGEESSNDQIYQNFNFAIPAQYKINGVQVQIYGYYSGGVLYIDWVSVRTHYGTVPTPVIEGSTAYASNGRKAGETEGNGTGTLTFWDGGAWIATDSGVPVDD